MVDTLCHFCLQGLRRQLTDSHFCGTLTMRDVTHVPTCSFSLYFASPSGLARSMGQLPEGILTEDLGCQAVKFNLKALQHAVVVILHCRNAQQAVSASSV